MSCKCTNIKEALVASIRVSSEIAKLYDPKLAAERLIVCNNCEARKNIRGFTYCSRRPLPIYDPECERRCPAGQQRDIRLRALEYQAANPFGKCPDDLWKR